jgi:hypothetical protein
MLSFYLLTATAIFALYLYIYMKSFKKNLFTELISTIALSFLASYIFLLLTTYLPSKNTNYVRGNAIAFHMTELKNISNNWKVVLKEAPRDMNSLAYESYLKHLKSKLARLENKYIAHSNRLSDLALGTDLEPLFFFAEKELIPEDITCTDTQSYCALLKSRSDRIELIFIKLEKLSELFSLASCTLESLKDNNNTPTLISSSHQTK